MSIERALVVLTPYESRRLIAKAAAALPAIRQAKENGWIIIATGSTTGYVAEEILGQSLVKENFISGHITLGETWNTPDNPNYIYPIVLHRGVRQSITPSEAIKSFGPDDVFIKGANAVDPEYRTGIFMANDMGGTIGSAIGALYARGAQLVLPVGLEKMIPDVREAARHAGNKSFKYHTGSPVGIMPILQGTVITEIQALEILYEVRCFHVGSGGIAGSEGAVVLVLEDEASKVAEAYSLIQAIKGEKPLQRPNGKPCQ